MGPLGELGALFNPGMRHEEEEKRAKEMLREEEGTGRKGRLGIDLESGVVVIGSNNDGDDRDNDRDNDRDTEQPANDSGEAAENGGTGENPARPAGRGAKQASGRGERDDKPAKPGVPQVAARSSAAVPAGKARRQQEGKPTAQATAPVGKARRKA